MLPVIALVGRPNVGKSTLFNQLTRSRDALVADHAGLTRDRKYGEGKLGIHKYIVIDTGGISGNEEGIDSKMAAQSLNAIDEADVVLFLVDAQQGLTVADEMIANHLRKTHKRIWVVLNKTDKVNEEIAATEFFGFGMGSPLPIAAAHGRGVSALIDEVLADFVSASALPESASNNTIDETMPEVDEKEQSKNSIKIAIIGRPNVGKSTLVNCMLGEDRVIVYDQAGTTRDSIYIPYSRNGQDYTIIDTAGVRRKGKVTETVEKFSVVKALQAIESANVIILVLDAREGVVDQDLHMLGYALQAGKSLTIAMNKWDGMTLEARQSVKDTIDRRLVFINFAKIHFISAKHGSGVGDLYRTIKKSYQASMQRWTANKLTRILEDAVQEHQPPLVHGHRIKLRYCHMGGNNPPTFIIHGNQTSEVPKAYSRYLENKFRSVLNILGTPIRIEFKTGNNPFADKKNKLTDRQIKKRQRMVKHVKKVEKKRKRKSINV